MNQKIYTFTKDNNYFIVSYVHGFHLIVTLGTVGTSPHILPKVFFISEIKKQAHIFMNWNVSTITIFIIFSH